jgi:hypothetical protein
MKTLVSTLFLLLVSIITFGQNQYLEYTSTTDPYLNTGKANGGEYKYKATVKCRASAPGLGDVRVQCSILSFEILSFEYDGKYYKRSEEGFPMVIDNIQSDLDVTFKFSFNSWSKTFFSHKIYGVRKGAFDLAYLTDDEVKKLGLKTSKDFYDLGFSFSIESLTNTYFEELDNFKNGIKKGQSERQEIESIKKSEKPKTKPKKRAKPKKKFNQNEYNATQRYRVSLLLPKYKNTYNYKEKRILLNELRGLTSYMSASDRKRIEKDVRKNNRDRTIEKISKSLVDIDYGRGERRFLIYLASGFTAISGKNDDQSAVGIPIKAGLEITFPVARKLTIDLIGEYNTHFFPDFSFLVADEVDNSYLDGIDISQLDIPEVTETTNLTRYTYGVGFTLGRKRLVTLSVLSQNIKYQYLKTEEQQTDIIIGENINIPTFGFGFTYNRHGKDKQDLGKISVSYTTNDKNLSFLNTEFENNKYSNLNVNAQTGLGALFIGFEYNLFMDGVNEANNVTSWGIKLGIKFGG